MIAVNSPIVFRPRSIDTAARARALAAQQRTMGELETASEGNDFFGTFAGCQNRGQLAAYLAATAFESKIAGAIGATVAIIALYAVYRAGGGKLP